MLSRTGSDVHDTVRGPHGVLVMLHHQYAVAQIPEMGQRLKELVIIPLMEPDAGLVQDIGHSHQAGAYLGSQTDALGLSA